MRFFNQNANRMIAVAIVAAATGLGTGIAIASQPNMEAALNSLQGAQSYLDRVTQDKDGHASAARHLVAEAIGQVQAGIAYGQAHGE